MKKPKPDFARAIWRMWRKAQIQCGQKPETWKEYQHRNRETPNSKRQRDRIYACIAKGASCEVPYVSVLKP